MFFHLVYMCQPLTSYNSMTLKSAIHSEWGEALLAVRLARVHDMSTCRKVARHVLLQAEVTRLQRERAELEDRAEEAEGGLAAAQTEMETSRKRLEDELASTRTEARRNAEEAKLEHSSEVGLSWTAHALRSPGW